MKEQDRITLISTHIFINATWIAFLTAVVRWVS